ncbi:transmembrane protein 198 isoform X1 [Stigmatopora argus]
MFFIRLLLSTLAPLTSVDMASTGRLLGLAELGLKCDQQIERRYEIVPSVICSMSCLFGIIYCFFGYRCFKAVLFLTGLMFGSVVIFMLCYKERVMDTQLSIEASVGIGLGIGTLCGLVTMLVRSVGLFMVGLLLGLLVGVASLVVMEEFYHPRTVWVPLGILLSSGTLFAVLTLQWQRCFVTFSTATFGSAIITITVDYFIELFAMVHYVFERLKVSPKKPVCWFTWVIMGVWPILALLGVLIQWKVTAEGFSHTEVVLSRQQRRVQLMRIRQREERLKKENENKKKKQQNHKSSQKQKTNGRHHQQYHHPGTSYPHHPARSTQPPKVPPSQTEPSFHRKPHPKKRFEGDVLSPSYIRSFRDRQTDRRAYSHSRMMSRSRMAELDYDCGSQVPLTAPSGAPVRI